MYMRRENNIYFTTFIFILLFNNIYFYPIIQSGIHMYTIHAHEINSHEINSHQGMFPFRLLPFCLLPFGLLLLLTVSCCQVFYHTVYCYC